MNREGSAIDPSVARWFVVFRYKTPSSRACCVQNRALVIVQLTEKYAGEAVGDVKEIDRLVYISPKSENRLTLILLF